MRRLRLYFGLERHCRVGRLCGDRNIDLGIRQLGHHIFHTLAAGSFFVLHTLSIYQTVADNTYHSGFCADGGIFGTFGFGRRRIDNGILL